MAETPPKRKAQPKRDTPSVLGTLPASRPQRIGKPRREPAAKPRAARSAAPRVGPKAVRPASPPLHVTRVADAPPPRPLRAPTGTELVTTTIRAAGELAQVGLTVGGQLLKRTLDRIPRP